MNKTLLFVIGIFHFLSLKAQDHQHFSIVPMQAGTIKLNTGNTMTKLSDDVQNVLNDTALSATYYVVFTPVENADIPKISNKTNKSFTVILNLYNKNQNNDVDYIVFVKRKIIQLNPAKNINSSLPNN